MISSRIKVALDEDDGDPEAGTCSRTTQTKKNTMLERQRKRQKRKEDENQLGVKQKVMDKAKVSFFIRSIVCYFYRRV